ncbi:MAG: hypothetical protein ACLP81_03115 [Acidimicrobiales bacterium]
MTTRRRRRRRSGAFGRLSGKIARAYERKGYSKRRARYIGRATAGRVARAKKRR